MSQAGLKIPKVVFCNKLSEPWNKLYRSSYRKLLKEHCQNHPSSVSVQLILERVAWYFALMKQAEARAGAEKVVDLQLDKHYQQAHRNWIKTIDQYQKYTETKKTETKKTVEIKDYSQFSDAELESMAQAVFGRDSHVVISAKEIN